MFKSLLDKFILPFMIMFIAAAVTYAISFSVADAALYGKIETVRSEVVMVDMKHDAKNALLAERCANLQKDMAKYQETDLQFKQAILETLNKLERRR